MGLNKFRFNKNSEKCVTLELVSVSRSDPNYTNSDVKQVFKRKVNPNTLKKKKSNDAIPNKLHLIFSPDDFGIHQNLTDDQIRLIGNSIYGTEKTETLVSEKLKNDLIDEFNQKLTISNDLNDLDGDCYFPKDGYDYEQHLAVVGQGGGTYIPSLVESTRGNGSKKGKAIPGEEDVLEALNSSENYEELNEEFIYQAQTLEDQEYKEFDVNKFLWSKNDSTVKFQAENFLNEYSFDYSPDGCQISESSKNGIIDKKLELILREYTDSELGDLEDHSNIDNMLTIDDDINAIDAEVSQDFEDNYSDIRIESSIRKEFSVPNHIKESDTDDSTDSQSIDKSKVISILNRIEEDDLIYEEKRIHNSDEIQKDRDIESVISNSRSIVNIPFKLRVPDFKVKAIHIHGITELPVDFMTQLNRKEEKCKRITPKGAPEEVEIPIPINNTRERGESRDARKERKNQVKIVKRLRRRIKSVNAEVFMKETQLQNKLCARNNYDIRPGTKFFKL